ncbi:fimbrial chaperone [Salmonella enterica]|uniref:Fimbrial chaperone n=1 Tax=Salmonella enterica subsp. enterica serovar Javiana TaxID=363569 RepID=A0A607KL63_SALET|nr:fimbrial chaperone [Salmonella enterica]EAR0120227.1 fimbrial chaperone [Salmonella enterica subsp. enterica serovar Javiana]EBF4799594.1 fimbrial chaperone [Salmonella enterica subsp. enterica]EDY0542918.1 fimbrial chaperone [Salmonella enterica subsp. enterica serovar Panama]EAN6964509.1 fimbrial chaperone [Salmonella enterica]
MNKVLKQTLVATTLMLMASQSMAAFTLNGTRFIYEEGKKNTSFEVSNSAKETYGGQVWIDNTTQPKDSVSLVPSPPFFKVKPGGKQIIRLMSVNPALPKDRESLFWLNVQEVPPMPENVEGSVLAIAMNTQVKVFYRPKSLVDGRRDAEKNITVATENGKTVLKNPTPYYFAVTGVKLNGKNVTLQKGMQDALAQLAPYSDVNLGTTNLNGKVSVEAINDWGGEQWYEIK